MLIYQVEGFDPTQCLLDMALTRPNKHALGKAAKDVARANGETMGFIEGLSEALVVLAVQARIDKISQIFGGNADPDGNKHVQAPDAWEIRNFMEHWRHEYEKVGLPLEAGATKDERATQRAELKRLQEKVERDYYAAWENDIVWHEQIASDYEGQRRSLIRSGKLEPTAADVSWLQEELEAMSAVTTPLQKLVAKAKNNG